MTRPTDEDYAALLQWRSALRHFTHWSEERAHEHEVTPAQHQLMLAIRGHRDRRGPTISDLAGYLLTRHHSVVGLIDRAVAAGLVQRAADAERAGVVRVTLTRTGRARLDDLSSEHLRELARIAPAMLGVWATFDRVRA